MNILKIKEELILEALNSIKNIKKVDKEWIASFIASRIDYYERFEKNE